MYRGVEAADATLLRPLCGDCHSVETEDWKFPHTDKVCELNGSLQHHLTNGHILRNSLARVYSAGPAYRWDRVAALIIPTGRRRNRGGFSFR